MNDQFDNPVIFERTANDMNSPEANPEPFTDKVPVEADLTHEASIGETVVHEKPVGETIIQETSIEESVVHETPISGVMTHETPIGTDSEASASMNDHEETEQFRTRWNEIQGKFVDEPRSAVEQADKLVTEMFNNEHRSLEAQWNKGNDVSTEELRIVLQRYRSFYNKLVVQKG